VGSNGFTSQFQIIAMNTRDEERHLTLSNTKVQWFVIVEAASARQDSDLRTFQIPTVIPFVVSHPKQSNIPSFVPVLLSATASKTIAQTSVRKGIGRTGHDTFRLNPFVK
jgi:hypothetical protein